VRRVSRVRALAAKAFSQIWSITMSYVYLERKDLGASLSSWITTAMNALNAAFAERLTGYIHWPEHHCADAGEKQMQDWVSPASGYERGMQAVLLILLFSKCKYPLKNNANLSDIATRRRQSDRLHMT
jgi:hypothetical protein